MKKAFLCLSLGVAALGFLMSPAVANGAPVPSDADQAFVASLAVQVGAPAPVLAAKHPKIGQKALCTATAACDVGSVSCSGNSSSTSCAAVDRNCAVGEPGHVTCDGVTTTCSNPCPPPACDCAALRSECIGDCAPCAINFTCNATTCATSCSCRIINHCNIF